MDESAGKVSTTVKGGLARLIFGKGEEESEIADDKISEKAIEEEEEK